RNIELGVGLGVWCLAYSPDGTRIAAGGYRRVPRLRVWDAETGAAQLDLRGLPGGCDQVGFRGDGSRLIAMGSGTIQEWDVSALRARSGASWPIGENDPGMGTGVNAGLPLQDASLLALSDDGSRLAVVVSDSESRLLPQVTVLDTGTGRELARYSRTLPRALW